MQRVDQLLDARGVLVVAAGDQHVGVGRIGAFDEQGVLGRHQAGFQRVVGVDQRQVHVVQRTRQHGRFQFAELQLLGVLDNIRSRGQDVGRVLELDDALLLQQHQCAAAIGRIIGDGDRGAVLQVRQALDLLGVTAEGLDMDQRHRHEGRLAVLVEAVQVRLVLEEVGVQLLVRQLQVGLHVVAEHLDVELHAFLGQLGLDHFKDLGVRNLRGADDHLLGMGRIGGNQKDRRRQGGTDEVQTHVLPLLCMKNGDRCPRRFGRAPFCGASRCENAPNLPECRLFVGHKDMAFQHKKPEGTTIRRMLALAAFQPRSCAGIFLTPANLPVIYLPT